MMRMLPCAHVRWSTRIPTDQVVQLLVRDARAFSDFTHFSLTSSSFPALEIPDQRRVLFVVTHAALGGKD
jgi:hypothetical protein